VIDILRNIRNTEILNSLKLSYKIQLIEAKFDLIFPLNLLNENYENTKYATWLNNYIIKHTILSNPSKSNLNKEVILNEMGYFAIEEIIKIEEEYKRIPINQDLRYKGTREYFGYNSGYIT